MEHRYFERKPLAVDVIVACPRVGIIRGRTTDVGCGGMFVATDGVEMTLNMPVTVSFAPQSSRELARFQVPAMVVHQRANGFGLMFDELAPACRTALRGLLATSVTAEQRVPELRRAANG